MNINDIENGMKPEDVTKEKNRKKALIPMFIAVLTLAVLAAGATYAYIQVQTYNNFGNPTITGTVPSIGSVAITTGTSLSLTTTRQGMMDENPTVYYATPSGINTSDSNFQTIGTATVSGAGTFTCYYTLNVKGEGALLSNSQNKGAGLVTLEVKSGTNGNTTETYDFNNDLTGTVLSGNGVNLYGTFTDLTVSQSRTIEARFKLTNSANQDQTALNGTTGTITFTLSGLSCTATA